MGKNLLQCYCLFVCKFVEAILPAESSYAPGIFLFAMSFNLLIAIALGWYKIAQCIPKNMDALPLFLALFACKSCFHADFNTHNNISSCSRVWNWGTQSIRTALSLTNEGVPWIYQINSIAILCWRNCTTFRPLSEYHSHEKKVLWLWNINFTFSTQYYC